MMANNVFNQVSYSKPKTNRFDLSHEVKLSFNMGELVPTCLVECVPGDKFTVSSENMFRFAPMLAPVMHRVKAYTHFFFVPTRILWPNFETFITHSKDGKLVPDENLPVWPFYDANNLHIGSVGDYLGLPVDVPSGSHVFASLLPAAAYRKIYFDYYRDENLSSMVADDCLCGDGAQNVDWYTRSPFRRAWMHDYFTSALPFAQKGEPVSISPVTTFSDVDVYGTPQFGFVTSPNSKASGDAGFEDGSLQGYYGSPSASDVELRSDSGLKADTSSLQVGSISINDLRRASKLQQWLEKNARGGSRYIESNEVHFGVKSSDKRLNRSEFIGGSSQNVVISEVLQTSQTDEGGTPQANMAGHGVSVGSGAPVSYFCEEHGFIVGITSIMPVTAYQQGLNRMFSRSSSLDYYWPSFAHLGEQEILNKELYISADDNVNNGTFGYIPRYSEYKYVNSRVAGDFRDELSFWHLGRIFDSAPALNEEFISCSPSNRIFAVTDENVQHIYAHVYNNMSALRRMPVFGTPKL